MSQFELRIIYIWGEDNTVADALLHLQNDDSPIKDAQDEDMPNYVAWSAHLSVAAISTISADAQLLRDVKAGYDSDPFCQRAWQNATSFPSLRDINSLFYIGDQFLIPNVSTVWEALFRTVHNVLGHFSAEKFYTALCESFFWPGMRKDLAKAYVPSYCTAIFNSAVTGHC
jgi:hypothetical protein